MKRILIILGMHRSGTSLVANWLNKCNLNLGDRLLAKDISNTGGHFEDLDFLTLHQQILTHYKIQNSGLVPPFDFELNDHYYYKKFKNNIKFKNSLYKQWGWKEPRTCLFINYYKELLPKAKYLILYRDYRFVVDSLIRRDYIVLNIKYHKLSESEQVTQSKYFESELENLQLLINIYLTTWIIYNQNILSLINSISADDYILISYDKLIENDEKVFSVLKKWKFNLTHYPFSSVYNPKLINNRIPDIIFDSKLEAEAIEIKNKMDKILSSNL